MIVDVMVKSLISYVKLDFCSGAGNTGWAVSPLVDVCRQHPGTTVFGPQHHINQMQKRRSVISALETQRPRDQHHPQLGTELRLAWTYLSS